jgi:2,3-bisphosphoglycerate-dependent phosphoglycerate mutase
MHSVVLIRHASAQGQEESAPLTEAGVREAEHLAGTLAALGIERVISSPFARATATIAPFCQRAKIQLEIDARLRERVLTLDAIVDWREHLRRSFDEVDYELPGGESSATAQSRALEVIGEAVRSARCCALVTHGNLLSLMLRSVDPTVGYAAWSRLSNPDVHILECHTDGTPVRSRRVWT